MKWLGVIFIVSATTWFGFDISRTLSTRTKQIKLFIHSLQMMEAEMSYSHLTLQQIFQNLSLKLEEPLQSFYGTLAEQLSGVVTDFISIWDFELDSLSIRSSMKKSEFDILKQFGRQIGHHHFIQQQKQIKLTIQYLERELDDAMEKSRKYEKMAKSLGILIGLFIVLLLI